MNDDINHKFHEHAVIENAPKFKSMKCRVLVFLFTMMLSYGALVIGVVFFYMTHSALIAGLITMVSFLAFGVISSKLRLSYIPHDQMERDLTHKEIARWTLKQTLCF